MAQRINPNILKLKISKGVFNNSHYKNLSNNKNLFIKFQEDLYLQKLIEGFFFIFNFYTSEIIINRDSSKININLLMWITNSNLLKDYSFIKNQMYFLNLKKFQNIFLNSLNTNTNKKKNPVLIKKNSKKNFIIETSFYQKKYYISQYNTLDYIYWNEIK